MIRIRHTVTLSIALLSSSLLLACDAERIALLKQAVCIPSTALQELYALASKQPAPNKACTTSREQADWPLYRAYPTMAHTVARIVLCIPATPVYKLTKLNSTLGECYIKRDDLTARKGFGGNKLRKAELLFADILKDLDYSETVMTFGCVGSNHTVAMACCAQQLGLRCIVLLKPQPPSHAVQKNLLLMAKYGAHIIFYPNEEKRTQGAIALFKEEKKKSGSFPYVIPTGGALPLGTVGYVNAAFELKEQITQKLIPLPDYIYVAAGGTFSAGTSCGTTAGLVLGLKAAGLPIIVRAVCSQPEDARIYRTAVMKLIQDTNKLLHAADKTFPLVSINLSDLEIITDCSGTKYGLYTQQGIDAMKLLHAAEGIKLDGTYSGKAFGALIRDAQSGTITGKKVLFWHTFCGHSEHTDTHKQAYTKLPHELHQYFTGALQPLDY